jgi:hypothetical protein
MAWPKLRRRKSPGAVGNGNSATSHGSPSNVTAQDSAAKDQTARDGTANGSTATLGRAASTSPAPDNTPATPSAWPNANGSAAPSPANAPEAAETAEGPADVPFWEWEPSGESGEQGEDPRDGTGDRAAASARGRASSEPAVTPVEPAGEEPQREGIGQHLGNLAHLSANPRMRAWQRRAIIAIIVGVAFLLISHSWRLGLTLAVLAAIADTIYRSRRPVTRKGAGKLNAAQRRTRKQLAKLKRAGYQAIHAVHIPGSDEQIDHFVVGRAGVFSIDSEAWDKRMPVRTSSHRQLYLGPQSMRGRLEHAQWESEQVAARLRGELGGPVAVRPAMAVYGPKIPWDVATIRDVDVFSGPRLRKYLRRRARQNGDHLLSAAEIERISQAAEKAFPHEETA